MRPTLRFLLAAVPITAIGCTDAVEPDVVSFARVAQIEVPDRVPAGTPLTVRFSYEMTCGRLDRIDVRQEAARTTISVVIRTPAIVNACPDVLRYAPVTLTLPPVTASQHVVRFRQPSGDGDSFLTVIGDG